MITFHNNLAYALSCIRAIAQEQYNYIIYTVCELKEAQIVINQETAEYAQFIDELRQKYNIELRHVSS